MKLEKVILFDGVGLYQKEEKMGTFLKYVFYLVLIIVIYLVGKGIYQGEINEKTTVGEVADTVESGAAQMAKSCGVDAVIAIGCVIRGDTPHFDYICQGATQGLAALNAEGDVPVIYGLLTCNNLQQAQDRAGGILGNKGDECAVTAIKMVDYKKKLR